MTKSVRILFWVSIIWIFICLFILIFGHYLPFQFNSDSLTLLFYTIVWLTFPAAVLVTLFKKSKNEIFKALKIVVALISFVFLGFNVFGKFMCGYIVDNVLFVNKSDTALKIVERHYDCGAYDSDFPKYEYHKIKYLTKQISYSKQVDTTLLKKSEWTRKAISE